MRREKERVGEKREREREGGRKGEGGREGGREGESERETEQVGGLEMEGLFSLRLVLLCVVLFVEISNKLLFSE